DVAVVLDQENRRLREALGVGEIPGCRIARGRAERRFHGRDRSKSVAGSAGFVKSLNPHDLAKAWVTVYPHGPSRNIADVSAMRDVWAGGAGRRPCWPLQASASTPRGRRTRSQGGRDASRAPTRAS